jgi:hypothetical protein
MFMNEKGKVVAELSDEKWFWDLEWLCGISCHLNDLNTELQGQQKPITYMFGAIKAFEMELKLFRK